MAKIYLERASGFSKTSVTAMSAVSAFKALAQDMEKQQVAPFPPLST